MEPGRGVTEVVNAILSTNCKCIVTDGRRGGRDRITISRAERMGVVGPSQAYSLRALSSQRFTAAWRTPDLSDPKMLQTSQGTV